MKFKIIGQLMTFSLQSTYSTPTFNFIVLSIEWFYELTAMVLGVLTANFNSNYNFVIHNFGGSTPTMMLWSTTLNAPLFLLFGKLWILFKTLHIQNLSLLSIASQWLRSSDSKALVISNHILRQQLELMSLKPSHK